MSTNDIIAADAQTCLDTINAGQVSVDEARSCYSNTCNNIEENIRVLLKEKNETDSLLGAFQNKREHFEAVVEAQLEIIAGKTAELRQLESELNSADSASTDHAEVLDQKSQIRARMAEVEQQISEAEHTRHEAQKIVDDLLQAEADLTEKSALLEEQIAKAEHDYSSFKSEGQAAISQLQERQDTAAQEKLMPRYDLICEKIEGR